jgi:hypothetical protein
MGHMRKLAALLAFVMLASCGSDGSAPTAPVPQSIVGIWTLKTVNGAPLPFTIAQVGSDKTEATSDQLTVTATRFTEVTQLRTTFNGQVTTSSETDTGTYVVSGANAAFKFDSDGSAGVGTIGIATLTIVQAGITLVYVR